MTAANPSSPAMLHRPCVCADPQTFYGRRWPPANRHPECDVFSGRTYVIWPTENVPGWARRGIMQCWALSALDYGDREVPFPDGEYPLGGHF